MEDLKPPNIVEQVNLRIVDTSSGEMWFKVKRTTKMSKIVSAYCGRAGKDREVVRFTYDGNRLKDDDTPDSLGMEENDAIDAYIEQVGGSVELHSCC